MSAVIDHIRGTVGRWGRSPREVNINATASKNYIGIQNQIQSAIARHLPASALTTSIGEYCDDALNLSLFIRNSADVLMSHGVADKRYLFMRTDEVGDRLVNSFAHVLVPGAWLRRRLLACDDIELTPDRIHVVGWPRLDLLLDRHRAISAQDPPAAERRLRVLWAPTHDYRKRGVERRSTSSYPEFEQHLPILRERFDVQVSLHPRNRKDKQPTNGQLLWADCVISDFGTMVYEAWALGKPVIFPRWILSDRIQLYLEGSAEAHIFTRNLGLHPRSIDELVDMLTEMPRSLGPDVDAFLADYLEPRYLGRSGRRVAQILDDLRYGLQPRRR